MAAPEAAGALAQQLGALQELAAAADSAGRQQHAADLAAAGAGRLAQLQLAESPAGLAPDRDAPLAPLPEQPPLECLLLQLCDYTELLAQRVVADRDDVVAALAPCSLRVCWALGDPSLSSAALGRVVQLLRRGYYRVDAVLQPGRALRLIRVPEK